MGLIAWLVIGSIAGFIASKVVHHSGSEVVMDVVLGIVGAFVGGFIFDFFGHFVVNGFDISSMLLATVGAIVVLFLFNAVTHRRV